MLITNNFTGFREAVPRLYAEIDEKIGVLHITGALMRTERRFSAERQ